MSRPAATFRGDGGGEPRSAMSFMVDVAGSTGRFAPAAIRPILTQSDRCGACIPPILMVPHERVLRVCQDVSVRRSANDSIRSSSRVQTCRGRFTGELSQRFAVDRGTRARQLSVIGAEQGPVLFLPVVHSSRQRLSEMDAFATG